MSIEKKFFPKQGFCRVKFRLPDAIANQAKKVAVVGDFNSWHPEHNLMKKDKQGKFNCVIDLPLGKKYEFRYLIDSYQWESDWETDGLANTPYEETYNSVIRCDEVET